jgi:hypothetical protein
VSPVIKDKKYWTTEYTPVVSNIDELAKACGYRRWDAVVAGNTREIINDPPSSKPVDTKGWTIEDWNSIGVTCPYEQDIQEDDQLDSFEEWYNKAIAGEDTRYAK